MRHWWLVVQEALEAKSGEQLVKAQEKNMDELTLQKLKRLFATEGSLLHQNEDGTFTLVKSLREGLSERMITETVLLEECRKKGWIRNEEAA